jgi:hypothetical protein
MLMNNQWIYFWLIKPNSNPKLMDKYLEKVHLSYSTHIHSYFFLLNESVMLWFFQEDLVT